MVDAPTKPTEGQTPASSDPELSHLAGLHRMSRTAGLGSSDYTAVNTLSVVGLIVAGASALALVTPFFLLLSILGVVLAVMAIVQIRNSGGTQTGLPLAALALLLSATFSGISGVKYINSITQEKADIRELDELVQNFGKAIAEQKDADAYLMTDTRFQEGTTLPQFQNLWQELAKAPTLGALQGARTQKLFVIEADPETGYRMAIGNALLDTKLRQGNDAFKTEMRFRNKDGKWRIYSIPQLFAGKQQGAAGAGGAAGGSGPAPAGPAGP